MNTRVRGRPKFEAALAATREIKAHAPHCRVIFTVYEMKRLGRDAAELTALADHLAAHGLVLEMLAGALAGIYDPTGHGRLPFAFFAAMAATERDNTASPPARAAPRRRYCSTARKSAWFRQYRRNARALYLMAAHTIGRGPTCPGCGHRLAPGYFTRSDQVLCSGRCRTAAWRERERAGSAALAA
ncbi:recombinase family protein [Streptomyces zaomyceticus]|uniref:recombinase family protein n=1 Tax=Streptomyces zaomyceticus TaxID=68286 RepID=UPI0035DCCC75